MIDFKITCDDDSEPMPVYQGTELCGVMSAEYESNLDCDGDSEQVNVEDGAQGDSCHLKYFLYMML